MIDPDYFGKSTDGIADVNGKMSQDTVVKNFSFEQTKFAYILTEALGPYFWKTTLDEVGRKQLLKVLTFLNPNEVSKPVLLTVIICYQEVTHRDAKRHVS